ncbi:Lnb N-terminal periplasmic domain-containing protein [Psychrobacter sp. I-STPA10]|uniref:Lnb N-terminal periplasmic domain-containing protein n=1 Tax=Psychrobacter sp. I-STPA10 TaxID=2585769 RepID=UPI001E3CFD0E|nr:DUF4105 domain-containing protein [Psychrobacter sp. I-STPA10]
MTQQGQSAQGVATKRKWLLCFFIATALLLASLWLLLALWYQLPKHLLSTWTLLFIVSASLLAVLINLYLCFYYSSYRLAAATTLSPKTPTAFTKTEKSRQKCSKKLNKNHYIKCGKKRSTLVHQLKKLASSLHKHKFKKQKHSKHNRPTISNDHIINHNIKQLKYRKYAKYTKYCATSHAVIWLLGLGWYLSLTPQQHRAWKEEVQYLPKYQRDANNPNLITIYNVRNFIWQTCEYAIPRWQTRQIDLRTLAGVDISNTYWMGDKIAHTIVSFRFKDTTPLAFSLEIRKEQHESFSTLGGFFRQYELTLIAAEELDIIYTRTNIRGEQVYLFPLSNLRRAEIKALFEAYLNMADKLHAHPKWYNTLTSNCTTLIYYMARQLIVDEYNNLSTHSTHTTNITNTTNTKSNIKKRHLPWDYRIWASGYLPNYLYDIGLLNHKWDIKTWYQKAHVNPKVSNFHNTSAQKTDGLVSLDNLNSLADSDNSNNHDNNHQSSTSLESQFSQRIRQGL